MDFQECSHEIWSPFLCRSTFGSFFNSTHADMYMGPSMLCVCIGMWRREKLCIPCTLLKWIQAKRFYSTYCVSIAAKKHSNFTILPVLNIFLQPLTLTFAQPMFFQITFSSNRRNRSIGHGNDNHCAVAILRMTCCLFCENNIRLRCLSHHVEVPITVYSIQFFLSCPLSVSLSQAYEYYLVLPWHFGSGLFHHK